jgi:pimeloyl-ACP methyl ester carboxylesterase
MVPLPHRRRTARRLATVCRTHDRRAVLFIGGTSDWGTFQTPGAFERMQQSACTDMRGAHRVDGAGHWVQQEQLDEVAALLLRFLRDAG